jgi:hypothetical protein
MAHCEQRIGEASFRTPRTTIKAFIGLLAVMEQNDTADWRVLLDQTGIEPDSKDDIAGVSDALVSLTL